jgi:NAD(P)-dependent dehydrogenase (short-subunit alcohol dehydrogenase family)
VAYFNPKGELGSYYAVSKLTVIGLTLAFAPELRVQNIRVNWMAP